MLPSVLPYDQKIAGWTILLDETDDAKKPLALTRQLIAIRNHPL